MALDSGPFGTRMGQETTASTDTPTEVCATSTEPLSADANEGRTTGTAAITAAVTV